MVDYIEGSQLIIELWGSQKNIAKPSAAKPGDKKKPGSDTKALMAAERKKVKLVLILINNQKVDSFWFFVRKLTNPIQIYEAQ